MTFHSKLMSAALLALVGLYLFWFALEPDPLSKLLVFALPPALLVLALWAGWSRAPFIAAVLALAWFSHGIMVAWSHPEQAQLGTIEWVLALVVVFLAVLPGLRARMAARR